jgi:hypothetical protein
MKVGQLIDNRPGDSNEGTVIILIGGAMLS